MSHVGPAVSGQVTSYAYNSANQLCWTAAGSQSAGCGSPPSGATVYSYDANGSEIDGTGGRFSFYNVKDQLTRVTPPGGTAQSFTYPGPDHSERLRIGSKYAENSLLGVGSIGSTHWTRDPGGRVLSQRPSSGAKHYYLRDSLGSIIALTDSAGNTAATYTYDPYGNTTAETGSVENPWRFVGEHREIEGANLYKIGVRYYDPTIGRWTQTDPLDSAGDLRNGNRYVYAAGDPVNLTDPTGRYPGEDFVNGVGDFLSSDAGSFVSGCVGGGATAGGFVAGTGAIAVPGYGQVTTGLAALGGCVVGGGLSNEYGVNPIRTR